MAKSAQQFYHDLSYYTLSLGDKFFIHQLIVDTFAAQNYNAKTKPITITFALVGLYLVNEKSYTGRQVQLAHIALARKTKIWPSFDEPIEKARLTIEDIAKTPDTDKQNMIKEWSRQVWDTYKPQKEKVAKLLKKYLDIE
ncbi:MAG TPA: DUF5946 family protein [Patescibacteria group bacterium]